MAKVAVRKTHTHGRIGEAAVAAKCWMHGIPAYNTAGLRANFAGSDLLVDTADPRRKLLIQVKTGYSPADDKVYLTQCKGEEDLISDKFASDFVVFVNLDRRVGSTHEHKGELGFQHLSFFVVPREVANRVYRDAVNLEYERPLKTGGRRKLGNMSVNIPMNRLEQYKDAWGLIQASE